MGDSFQQIVDPQATEETTPRLARTVLRELIERGIICGETSDCVLSGENGYRPGPNFAEASEPFGDFPGGGTNGVCAEIGRRVFHNGENTESLFCPNCRADAMESDWTDAVGRWYDGDDAAAHTCPHCGIAAPITEWNFDFPWAFGYLGFTFWNWPPLRPEFIDSVAGILNHPVKLVIGKI